MKRLRLDLLAALCAMTIMSGCMTDSSVEPLEQESNQITFSNLPGQFSAPAGVERSFQFTVSVTSNSGTPLSGKELVVGCVSPSVILHQAHSTTDRHGEVMVDALVRMPAISKPVQIVASDGLVETTTTVHLNALPAPASIQLDIATPEITVVPNQNGIIDIKAIVTDVDGNGVAGIWPRIGLYQFEAEETFGSLTLPDTTDANGRTTAQFNTLGGSGKVRIIAYLEDSEGGENVEAAEDVLQVTIADQTPIEISISANPSYLLIPLDSIGVSTVMSRWVDDQNVGIEGQVVNYSVDFGTITPEAITDETGIATATFTFDPANDWPENLDGDRLEATVTASSQASINSGSKIITIERLTGYRGTLTLTQTNDFIYADEGLTVNTLTAVLQDAEGAAISGQPIIFTSTHGTANSPVYTDQFGIAKSVFKDNGLPSLDELNRVIPARIIAKYNPAHLSAIAQCEIRPLPTVREIKITFPNSPFRADSDESLEIVAHCYLEDGSPALPGTRVIFETPANTPGSLMLSNVVVGRDSKAVNFYEHDHIAGDIELILSSISYEGEVTSAEKLVTILPGELDSIALEASVDMLAAGTGERSDITATMYDRYGNRLGADNIVRFDVEIGNLLSKQAYTNEEGVATTTLVAGGQAGTATVTATSGEISASTTVEIVTTVPIDHGLIEWEFMDGRPTGGISLYTLSASFYDQHDNLITRGQQVWFELVDGTGRLHPNLPEDPRPGFYRGVLYPGLGENRIRACAIEEANWDTVCVETVLPALTGPPHSIELAVDSRGSNRDGGVWALEVSALVLDRLGSPVHNGIPVVFSLNPNIASIEAGYTGNENLRGETVSGLAFTVLTYNSQETFQDLTIEATIAGVDGDIDGELEYTLPLQGGRLTLNCDPDSIHFDNDDEVQSVRLWTTIKDGHNVLINSALAPLQYGSTRGSVTMIPNGAAALSGQADDFFTDRVTPEMSVTVWVKLTDDNAPTAMKEIVVTRDY